MAANDYSNDDYETKAAELKKLKEKGRQRSASKEFTYIEYVHNIQGMSPQRNQCTQGDLRVLS